MTETVWPSDRVQKLIAEALHAVATAGVPGAPGGWGPAPAHFVPLAALLDTFTEDELHDFNDYWEDAAWRNCGDPRMVVGAWDPATSTIWWLDGYLEYYKRRVSEQ